MRSHRHVAVYARKSDDKQKHVNAQAADGRAYAAEVWPGLPVEVYADNDESVSDYRRKHGRPPDLDRLLDDVAAGRVAYVWVQEQSRLARTEVEGFGTRDLLLDAGITEIHTDGKTVPVDSLEYGLHTLINSQYSRKLSQDINRGVRRAAEEGRPYGCGYGYRRCIDDQGRKSLEVVPEQAEVIREAADRVLKGWSLGSIARDLNARGIPPQKAEKWSYITVRTVITSPQVAGFRRWRPGLKRTGEATQDVLIPGIWEAILSEDIWRQVKAALIAPTRKVRGKNGKDQPVGTVPHPSAWRSYLLPSVMANCGECGGKLSGAKRHGIPQYYCVPTRGGCATVAIEAEALEEYVTDAVLAAFESPAFLAALAADDYQEERQRLLDALAGLEGQYAELAAAWGRGEFTMTERAAARAELDKRKAKLSADLAAVPPPATDTEGLEAARESWPHLSVDERRALLDIALLAVVVRPTDTKPKRAFSADRVLLVDRTGRVT